MTNTARPAQTARPELGAVLGDRVVVADGANLSNLGEYGLSGRIAELSEAGARIAREAADQWSSPGRPRWVLGSMGPGTKLPTLGHTRFADLRDAYQLGAAGLISGGTDAIIIETSQDLLQAKAAIIGAR